MFGHPIPRWPVGLVALLVAGCGSNFSTVEGTVSYDGTPIDLGSITFIPKVGEGKKVGSRIYDGKYKIESGDELSPGSYTVRVNWDKKTGKQIKMEGNAVRDLTAEGLPPKYCGNESQLTADITSGSNALDFTLTK